MQTAQTVLEQIKESIRDVCMQITEMEYKELDVSDRSGIAEMSEMATTIVREHFDPLIGKEQNNYMLAMFQTEAAIKKQLENGYKYFFVRDKERNLGFMAFFTATGAVCFLSIR